MEKLILRRGGRIDPETSRIDRINIPIELGILVWIGHVALRLPDGELIATHLPTVETDRGHNHRQVGRAEIGPDVVDQVDQVILIFFRVFRGGGVLVPLEPVKAGQFVTLPVVIGINRIQVVQDVVHPIDHEGVFETFPLRAGVVASA